MFGPFILEMKIKHKFKFICWLVYHIHNIISVLRKVEDEQTDVNKRKLPLYVPSDMLLNRVAVLIVYNHVFEFCSAARGKNKQTSTRVQPNMKIKTVLALISSSRASSLFPVPSSKGLIDYIL